MSIQKTLPCGKRSIRHSLPSDTAQVVTEKKKGDVAGARKLVVLEHAPAHLRYVTSAHSTEMAKCILLLYTFTSSRILHSVDYDNLCFLPLLS